MKKQEWKDAARRAEHAARLAEVRANGLAADIARLKDEIESMRKHWRPVPIAHPWQPRNPQCALCDEPRDAARHQDGENAWWNRPQ